MTRERPPISERGAAMRRRLRKFREEQGPRALPDGISIRYVDEFPACGRTTAPEPSKDVVTHLKQTAHSGRKRRDW